MATYHDDVREAFESITNAEIEESELSGGMRVAVPGSEAGQFFKTIRVRGFNAQSKRLGDTLVAHIESEEDEQETLGDLFG